MIPCYVGGAGVGAGDATLDFKIGVFKTLEESGLGYDTRYRYYAKRLPTSDRAQFARLVCDPIERYDPDWPAYCARHGEGPQQLARFVAERDDRFRAEARVAIYCYDEAGFGSGVNSLRLLRDAKPILGFYHRDPQRRRLNIEQVFLLQVEFPALVTLVAYAEVSEIPPVLRSWLGQLPQQRAVNDDGAS